VRPVLLEPVRPEEVRSEKNFFETGPVAKLPKKGYATNAFEWKNFSFE
jgi:hypothetical protein